MRFDLPQGQSPDLPIPMRQTILFLFSTFLTTLGSGLAQSPGARFSDSIQQPPPGRSDLLGLVEISAGSANKYELDEATGLLQLDRVLGLPLVYPANYGMFPQTLAGDGDALDFLLLARFPIHPGTCVLVRPLGVLRMRDGEKDDQKIICVPALQVDASFGSIQDLPDLAPAELERIEAFFSLYKARPDGTNPVQLNGFGRIDEATFIITEARQSWQASNISRAP